jgi:hypothetical protein
LSEQLKLGGVDRGVALFELRGSSTFAIRYFSKKYGIPILTKASELPTFSTILFSAHSVRDALAMARLAEKRPAKQEWIVGGSATAKADIGDVPRIELFARPPVAIGWDAWGNEIKEDAE